MAKDACVSFSHSVCELRPCSFDAGDTGSLLYWRVVYQSSLCLMLLRYMATQMSDVHTT